jgi:hypothetical protein
MKWQVECLVVSAASPQLCALVSALRGGVHSDPWWTCSPAAVTSVAPFPPAISSAVPPAAFAAQHIKLQVQICEIFWMPFTQQNRKQTKAKYVQSYSDIRKWVIKWYQKMLEQKVYVVLCILCMKWMRMHNRGCTSAYILNLNFWKYRMDDKNWYWNLTLKLSYESHFRSHRSNIIKLFIKWKSTYLFLCMKSMLTTQEKYITPVSGIISAFRAFLMIKFYGWVV